MKKHKRNADGHINTEGWMMSYADMATTLLAMFIVLSTLGKDQTGVSLYNGTGSFVHAMESFGLPGLFSNSSRVIQFQAPGPKYQLDGDEEERAREGPRDGETIDQEEERLQACLREIGRQV